MKEWKTQSHVMWDCKYHLVFITKYRQRSVYGKLRQKIGGIIRDLCRQKDIELHGPRNARSYSLALKHTT